MWVMKWVVSVGREAYWKSGDEEMVQCSLAYYKRRRKIDSAAVSGH